MYTLNLAASLIASVLLIYTAVFVLYKNKGQQSPIFYSIYNFSAAGILITMFLTYLLKDTAYVVAINRLTIVSNIMLPASMLNLSFTYPERDKPINLWIPFTVLIPAFIVAGISFFTNAALVTVTFSGDKMIRSLGWFYPIYAGIAISYFTASISVFVYNYIKIKNETYRLQIKYLIFGTFMFIAIGYLGAIIIPQTTGNYSFYILAPALAAVVATITLFYSIVAYNIMDFRTAIHKTAMYATLSATILLPILLIFYAASEIELLKNTPPLIIAGSSALIFMLFSYLFQPGIDAVFKRKQADITKITNNYIKKASRLKTLEKIIETSTLEIHRGLSLIRSVFFIYDDEKKLFIKSFDTQKSDKEEEALDRYFPLVKWFARNQEILPRNRVFVDDDSFKNSRAEIEAFFDKYDIALILPIYYENRITSLLCLGKKENIRGFSPDEVEKIYEYRARTNDFITSALTFDKAKKEQFISRSLNLSSEILEHASANKLPEMKNISFSTLSSPRYSKGVDYFDFLQPTKNSIGILCSDVSGIGINNALYSVILRSAFHGCINEAASPYTMLKRINLVLSEYTSGEGELVTAFYSYYDADTKRIFYTNAGFPPMEVFRIEKNDFDTLNTIGAPLGYDPLSDFGQGRTELKSGDICVVYSKSLINSRNNEGETFGLLRLRGAIRETRGRQPAEIAFNLKKIYEKFMNQARPDTDVTVLIMKVN